MTKLERRVDYVNSVYEMAGWDPRTGQPTPAHLAELGIDLALVQRA